MTGLAYLDTFGMYKRRLDVRCWGQYTHTGEGQTSDGWVSIEQVLNIPLVLLGSVSLVLLYICVNGYGNVHGAET